MNTDQFIDWVCSHYDNNNPGGHCNGFYPKKVINMLSKFSKSYEQRFRQSEVKEFRENINLDLELRKNISFYVEAMK